jgi:HSP20 family protein
MTVAFKTPQWKTFHTIPAFIYQPRYHACAAPRQRAASEQTGDSRAFTPAVNIAESADAVTLYIELPGVTKDHVQVNINEGRTLVIKGEKKQPASSDEQAAEQTTVRRSERRFGSFERRFTLGKHIDAESIQATFENGILEITFRKIQPKSVNIPIQ